MHKLTVIFAFIFCFRGIDLYSQESEKLFASKKAFRVGLNLGHQFLYDKKLFLGSDFNSGLSLRYKAFTCDINYLFASYFLDSLHLRRGSEVSLSWFPRNRFFGVGIIGGLTHESENNIQHEVMYPPTGYVLYSHVDLKETRKYFGLNFLANIPYKNRFELLINVGLIALRTDGYYKDPYSSIEWSLYRTDKVLNFRGGLMLKCYLWQSGQSY